MTRKDSNRTTSEIKAMMAEDGDFLRPIVRTVIQEFLEAEMAEAIGAQKGERVEGRSGYRSGYYPRSLITRVGKLELRIPQDRNGRFSTEIFERYQRSEKALVAALEVPPFTAPNETVPSKASCPNSTKVSFYGELISTKESLRYPSSLISKGWALC
jgi:hypothetical protein